MESWNFNDPVPYENVKMKYYDVAVDLCIEAVGVFVR